MSYSFLFLVCFLNGPGVEMSWAQHDIFRDLQKPNLGCMGRMINIFELSTGMPGTKLIRDKAHRDGSPVRRNRSDLVKRAVNPVGIYAEDRPTTNELKKSVSSKKAGGTPMKKLIEKEMLKETDSKRKPISVVARLMGLDDALAPQQPVLTAKKSLQEAYPRSKSAGAFRGHRQQEDAYFDRPRSREIHTCSHEKEYKDVYEVWHHSPRINRTRDQAPLKGRGYENQNDKRMDLVRQKFMEAKRLATDEKLLHSKEFQDALEVLSSNRDLFLKFLEEPNSLLSNHMKYVDTTPSLPQTKHITVLKPSKTVEVKSEKYVKNQQYSLSSGNELETGKLHRISTISHQRVENVSQPTRIVVLKPSPANTHDKKDTAAPVSSPDLPKSIQCYSRFGTDEAMGSREIAKEITRQMRENVSSHRRDESLLSSVLSNGYIGDDSSFDKSENELIEDITNFSDSEIMTPTSRNSWDYHNRMGSPYSLSPFSRASYSPESLVIREAKKRLSERWAMVATNAISREQMQVRRSSSTLGEMLAIHEIRKEETCSEVGTVSSSRSCGGEEGLREPAAGLSISGMKDREAGESSPKTISRSRSVPVLSSSYENIGLDVKTTDSKISKSFVPTETKKSKSGKSSFKGKVSSFFSRSKKLGKQKAIPSPLVPDDDAFQPGSIELICKNSDALSQSVHNTGHDVTPLVNSDEDSGKSPPASGNNGPKQSTSSCKVTISLEKPRTSEILSKDQNKLGVPGNSSEHQDQPSPTSVLDVPFVDDVQVSSSSELVDSDYQKTLSRPAPIESVARSLSWDGTDFERSLPNPLKLPREYEQEQDRRMFVQSLLSSAGLYNKKVSMMFTRWHSSDSPLDPVLLVKFLDRKEEEAKSRERRSSQRLLFDCVNMALLDIGKAVISGAYPWARACGEERKDVQPGAQVSEEVWRLLRDWFSGERHRVSGNMDNSSAVADKLLRKEVAGRRCTDLVQREIDEISEEIERNVLVDLVGEVLLDFTSEFSI